MPVLLSPVSSPCSCPPVSSPCSCPPVSSPCSCPPVFSPCSCPPVSSPCSCPPVSSPCSCPPVSSPCSLLGKAHQEQASGEPGPGGPGGGAHEDRDCCEGWLQEGTQCTLLVFTFEEVHNTGLLSPCVLLFRHCGKSFHALAPLPRPPLSQ